MEAPGNGLLSRIYLVFTVWGKLTVNEGFLAVCASFSLLRNLINRLHLKFLLKLRKNFKNIAFGGRPAATALFSTRYESVVTKVKA